MENMEPMEQTAMAVIVTAVIVTGLSMPARMLMLLTGTVLTITQRTPHTETGGCVQRYPGGDLSEVTPQLNRFHPNRSNLA